MNLADEDINSIPTDTTNKAIQGNVAMQVNQHGWKICNLCKWRHLVVKFATNASGVIWWPNLELVQVEPPLVEEITQVRDAIPWVRCASGNVFCRNTTHG